MSSTVSVPNPKFDPLPVEECAAAAFLVEQPAPRFLCARVTAGPPADYKRDWDLAACRLRFRGAFLDRQGTVFELLLQRFGGSRYEDELSSVTDSSQGPTLVRRPECAAPIHL